MASEHLCRDVARRIRYAVPDMNRALAGLLALLLSTHAFAQAKLARECEAEIKGLEAKIATERKSPNYQSGQGRHVLTTADRWLNQARRHAVAGEPRNCVSAAKKGWAQMR